MATGIQITPPSDITIGTTAIQNGTVGRVLFQGTGNVVQQDGAFFWDNTNKRLGLGSSSPESILTVKTSITNNVGNPALRVYGISNYIGMHYDEGVGPVFYTNYGPGFNSNSFTFKGETYQTLASIGTNGIFSHNLNGRISNSSGNGYINLWNGGTGEMEFFVTTNHGIRFLTNNTERAKITNAGLFGIGTSTPAARLDVRAQGALSTDIAFRVRNSSDSHNLMSIAGNNQILVGWTNEQGALSINGASRAATDVVFSALGLGSQQLFYGQQNGVVRFGANANRIEFDGSNWNVTNTGNVNWNMNTGKYFLLGQASGIGTFTIGTFTVIPKSTSASEYVTCITNPSLTGDNYFQRTSNTNVTDIFNATTAPSTNVTNAFRLYSADIVAGNAAPHFRTENGSIIKLYQQSSAGVATVADLVNILKNVGLLS